MELTICIATYQRPEKIPLIIDDLNNQTYKGFRLKIWNNSNKKLDVSGAKFPVKVVDSPENLGSKARFYLVQTAETPKIIFLDDDERVDNDFVEYLVEMSNKYPRHLLGWFTRIFDKEDYWQSIPYSPENTAVDYVGTGGMIVEKDLFDSNTELYDIPPQYDRVEDLFLSYIARKNGYKLMAVKKKCRIEPDGKDQYKKLTDYKTSAFRMLRRNGWKLLKDK